MENFNKILTSPEGAFPRIAPFAMFMVFIAIQEGLGYLSAKGVVGITDNWFLYLYPIKTVSVALLLFLLRKNYSEIRWCDLASFLGSITAVLVGIIVFGLWINMDWSWATIGSPKGFDPTIVSDIFTRNLLVAFRIIGAAVIVPVMEELFWRSWLLRYLITPQFQSIELGRFTLPSFIIGSVMFGLEHNLWLAGIMAGALYCIFLYRTKSLVQCILAHAITNLLLGIYVLKTGKWFFW